VMVIRPRNEVAEVLAEEPVIAIKGEVLNVVKEFKYLGGTETDDTKMTREVAIRCQKIIVAYSHLRKICI
jgi:hypothetical protein